MDGKATLDLPNAVKQILACPDCRAELAFDGGMPRCTACMTSYSVTENGQLDLRLKVEKAVEVPIPIGGVTTDWQKVIHPIKPNPSPQIDYQKIPIPPLLLRGNRLTRELLSYFPYAKQRGVMLDFGCGHEPFRDICSHTNMEYVGFDYGGAARYLADGHALPFKNESFDFIISFAVLEHIRHPIVAMREAHRVLKPGGCFIGSVAFLEPWHLNSYYHFSPLAIIDTLSVAGFNIDELEANPTWNGLRAMSWMSLFPHSPMWLSNLLVWPLHVAHRLWWAGGHVAQPRPETSEARRQLVNTAGFRWVCSKR